MEFQGLSDAQNIHSSHGGLLNRTSPHARSKCWSTSRIISSENDTAGSRPRSVNDANNNRPPTPRLCLLARDDSEAVSTADCEPESCVIATLAGENSEAENEAGQLLGLYELAIPVVRNEAVLLNALPAEAAAEQPCGLKGEVHSNMLACAPLSDRNTQGVYVVLNVLKGEFDKTMRRSDQDYISPNIGIIRHVTEDRRCQTMDPRMTDLEVQPVSPACPFSNRNPNHAVPLDRTADRVFLSGKVDIGMSVELNMDNMDPGLAERGRLISETSTLLQDAGRPDLGGSDSPTDSTGSAACTASSGTGPNNQSSFVNVEDGMLSIAVQPGKDAQKENTSGLKTDGIVHFTHVFEAKDNESLSSLAVTNTAANDSSLSAIDSVEPCLMMKRKDQSVCDVTNDGVTVQSKKLALSSCDDASAKTLSAYRSKKDAMTPVSCPEPGCSIAFDSRQKLKVHLLTHADDPRPYQCTVEGCGWTFTTSYKLKRHLLSHDKLRPHTCQFEGCGRCFSTIYNLKAHYKVHVQEHGFICDVCSEKFRSATRLASHQRIHFEPQRPYKCEYTGCERTFITFSALFSHKRTHSKEMGDFTCTYPGCSKIYDKACRLKIHLRSHTGERPFICDSSGCAWTFTSMSKLLRHKRKHDDDRRFVCKEEGCGKSFTRAEHLKGHSITHLGTKPFQCHTEGCGAKFSARSSLYIHSKKHKQDANATKNPCPVSNCTKYLSSPSSLKSHMLKHHHLSSDVLIQMESVPTLTPSNELITSNPVPASTPCVAKGDQFTNLDLSSLFSTVSGGTSVPAGIGVGIPINGSAPKSFYRMDLSMASSGIISIDPSSVGTTLGSLNCSTGTNAMEPLAQSSTCNMGCHHALEACVGDVQLTQDTLGLDDAQMITSLGTLTALTIQTASVDSSMPTPLRTSGAIRVEPAATVAVTSVSELLPRSSKGVDGGSCPLDAAQVPTQYVFPTQSSTCPQQSPADAKARSPTAFSESGGSARTDYRAIQLAKKNKQNGPASSHGRTTQKKAKGEKMSPPSDVCATNAGRTARDHVAGAQYVQIRLLQDDPTSDGDLAFQLTPQPSASHSQLTPDLPVHILQEPALITEENSMDNSQFTGSTINLQDLE